VASLFSPIDPLRVSGVFCIAVSIPTLGFARFVSLPDRTGLGRPCLPDVQPLFRRGPVCLARSIETGILRLQHREVCLRWHRSLIRSSASITFESLCSYDSICLWRIPPERRVVPVKQRRLLYSSSFKVSLLMRRGLTMFESFLNSIRLNPPKVDAYWSCKPPGIPTSFLSTSYARFAMS